MAGEVDVRVPVYLTKQASMVEVLKVLSSGTSNMGLIYSDADLTGELRDFADKVMQSLTEGGNFEPGRSELDMLSRNNLMGVVTLENTIEMVL